MHSVDVHHSPPLPSLRLLRRSGPTLSKVTLLSHPSPFPIPSQPSDLLRSTEHSMIRMVKPNWHRQLPTWRDPSSSVLEVNGSNRSPHHDPIKEFGKGGSVTYESNPSTGTLALNGSRKRDPYFGGNDQYPMFQTLWP